MPLPVGHSLAGCAAASLAETCLPGRHGLPGLAVIALANLPDADFLPGYVAGAPDAYHHKAGHSLPAVLAVAALVGAGCRASGRRFAPCFVIAGAVGASHPLLDMLGPDTDRQDGVQLLWPLTDAYVNLPWSVFTEIKTDRARSHGFLRGLFNRHNLRAVAKEAAVMLPIALAADALRSAVRG